jgi:DNA-binding NtrC family response regulator
MSGDEDDKATVVIDINALKKLKEAQDNQLDDMAGSLEFSTDALSDDEKAPEKPSSACPVLLFDFSQGYFKESQDSLPSSIQFTHVETLQDLNNWLKKKTPLILIFGFDANPKAANQLCAQLKTKFKQVKTVIIAKGLSEKKVQIHQSSPAGANAYLRAPFEADQLQKTIENLLEKMVS